MQDNHKMNTLAEAMNYMKEQGYEHEFKIEDNLMTATDEESKRYNCNDVKINEHFRFEGESDPGDMAVLYAVETNDGLKGLLVDGFGTYSSRIVGDFVKKVEENTKTNGQ